MPQKYHPILFKDLKELETSEEFFLMAELNNFKNLNDITAVSVVEIMKMPGMNYRMLAELGEILNKYGLIDLMEDD